MAWKFMICNYMSTMRLARNYSHELRCSCWPRVRWLSKKILNILESQQSKNVWDHWDTNNEASMDDEKRKKALLNTRTQQRVDVT